VGTLCGRETKKEMLSSGRSARCFRGEEFAQPAGFELGEIGALIVLLQRGVVSAALAVAQELHERFRIALGDEKIDDRHTLYVERSDLRCFGIIGLLHQLSEMRQLALGPAAMQ